MTKKKKPLLGVQSVERYKEAYYVHDVVLLETFEAFCSDVFANSDYEVQQETRTLLCEMHRRKGMFEDVEKLASEGIRAAEERHDLSYHSFFLGEIGHCFLMAREADKAEHYFTTMLSYGLILDRLDVVGLAYYYLAVVARFRSDHDKQMNLINDSISFLRQSGEKGIDLLPGPLLALANWLLEYDELDMNLKLLLEVEQLLKLRPNKHYELALSCYLASYYLAIVDIDNATHWSEHAIQLVTELEARTKTLMTLSSLANCRIVTKQYQSALQLLLDSLPHANEYQVGLQYARIAAVMCLMEDYERSIEYVNLAFEHGVQSPEGIQEIQLTLAKCYHALGRFEEASNEFILALARKLDYRKSLKRKTIRQYAEGQVISQRELAERLSAEQIKHLEQQLSSTSLQLVAQSESLNRIVTDIEQLLKPIPLDSHDNITLLRKRLREIPCDSVNWELFDKQFVQAYPLLIKKLSDNNPALTETELRICYCLSIGLKSAQIGQLLCMSERTVETHRLHIRKKLSLATNVNLHVYFQTLNVK